MRMLCPLAKVRPASSCILAKTSLGSEKDSGYWRKSRERNGRILPITNRLVTRQYPTRNHPKAPSHQFTVVSEKMVSAIPDRLSFEQAATLPLPIALAAAGLYQKNHLGISLPYTPPSPTSRTILVLDGASDVGAMVVQLASASGMEVIATAPKRNFNIVRSFGASIVMDHDSLAQGALAAALDDLPLAGIFDTISTPQSLASIDTLLAIMEQSPPVCTLKPPAQSPSHFSPSIGELNFHNVNEASQADRFFLQLYLPPSTETLTRSCAPQYGKSSFPSP